MENEMTENIEVKETETIQQEAPEKEKQTVRQIMQTRRAEATQKEIKHLEETGNLTVDLYAGGEPQAFGKNVPAKSAENDFLMKQNAVLTGCHDKENGNFYVSVAAVKSDKSPLTLKEGEKMQAVMQEYWDKPGEKGKDGTRYVDVVNAAKLDGFKHQKPKTVTKELQDKMAKILEEKAFKTLVNDGTKDGKAYYDAARDIAHVPKTEDRDTYLKDLAFTAASREVAKRTMEQRANEKGKNGPVIKFDRTIESPEQAMLKHFVAADLRAKMGLGADERNGMNRESSDSKKQVIESLKKDEKMLFNVARRSKGITQAMDKAYNLTPKKAVAKEKTAEKKADKGQELTR